MTPCSPVRPRRARSCLFFAAALVAALAVSDKRPLIGQTHPTGFVCTVHGQDLSVAAAAVEGRALFVEQDPPVLTTEFTGTVTFRVVYLGAVPALRVYHSTNSGYVFDEFARVETSTLGGREVSVFQLAFTMPELVRRVGWAIDFEAGRGGGLFIAPASVPLSGGFPITYDSFFVRAMSRLVGPVPVVQIDDTAQYSSHVINLVLPNLATELGPADSFDTPAAARRFYEYFGDDYEQLGFVFREKPFLGTIGGSHGTTKNSIGGIGLPVFDNSAHFGSAGRLEGYSFYFNSLGNVISNHELSHQWGHFFNWQAIAGITRGDSSHTPLWVGMESPIPALIAPWSRLMPTGSGTWRAERAPSPTAIPPLQAYAMGLIPAASVPPIDIFENQSAYVSDGVVLNGPTRRISIDQIVAHHGVRQGPVVSGLRTATILISRERLASAREMDYWTWQAQRLEDARETGMISAAGVGSFRAVTGVPLRTALVLPDGQTLAAHENVEPQITDANDIWGVALDRGVPTNIPASGVFRMRGQIVEPSLKRATSIRVSLGTGLVTLTSPVAADGSFTIAGPVERPAGRVTLGVSVTIDGVSSSIGAIDNVQLSGGTAVPAAPADFRAVATGRSVALSWVPDTGGAPSQYLLEVGSSAGATDIGVFALAATSLSASNLADGTYFLRVRAVNAAGTSAASTEASFSIGCTSPQPATGLVATVNGGAVALTWQPSTTAGVSYTVTAGSASGAGDIAQVPVGSATSLTGVVPPGRYFVRVRAATACGASADSNEIVLSVGLPALPGAPGNLTHQVMGDTVMFAWQPATGSPSGYVIEAALSAAGPAVVSLAVGNATSFSVPSVPPGTYFVRVRASNAAGVGPASNEVTVVAGASVS